MLYAPPSSRIARKYFRRSFHSAQISNTGHRAEGGTHRASALPVTFRKVSSAKGRQRGGLMRISFSGATLAASNGILGGDGEPRHSDPWPRYWPQFLSDLFKRIRP